ncbi:MAG TPA: exonuclease domain-containing protein [Magnetospirillaceae bacterium]|jgi:hypothetical protein
MIFLDFEASGLQGFPIEIGWAIVHPDRRITVESHYIHCERWMDQIERWTPEAESIHGISRRFLIDFGKPPLAVALRANEVLAGATVMVDSPYDMRWSAELFAEAQLPQAFSFADVAACFAGPEVDEPAYEYSLKIIDKVKPKTHRAGEDAEHWATLYRMSLFG